MCDVYNVYMYGWGRCVVVLYVTYEYLPVPLAKAKSDNR